MVSSRKQEIQGIPEENDFMGGEEREKIKALLFRQKERPKGLDEVRIVNVFDDRYRINLWVRMDEDGLQKVKIGASYFARFDGENLHIRN